MVEETGLHTELLDVPAAVCVRSYRSDWSPTLGLSYAAIGDLDVPLGGESGQPPRWFALDEEWDSVFPEDRARIRAHDRGWWPPALSRRADHRLRRDGCVMCRRAGPTRTPARCVTGPSSTCCSALSCGARALVGLDLDQLEPADSERLRQAKKARLVGVRGKGRTVFHRRTRAERVRPSR
ncbi:hypothetical protein [Nonomuraea guangzhouensis]|uniref:8-oxo-dGTP diphosphatase n=1 Tax=Nonomuraea guangzhouensis TaxID=1291555 RepID=A0ABW4GUG4_9ACTN|nr:hypothetical protein [Nonomuraea guangzhouensis]